MSRCQAGAEHSELVQVSADWHNCRWIGTSLGDREIKNHTSRYQAGAERMELVRETSTRLGYGQIRVKPKLMRLTVACCLT